MPEEWTKDRCVLKYNECKLSNNGVPPKKHEFLKYSGISKLQLDRLFGSSPYSALQAAAGDKSNKPQFKRTPLNKIMEQYGRLVVELSRLPTGPEWEHRGLKPSIEGLRRKPHKLNWTELSGKFLEWVESEKVPNCDEAVRLIKEFARSEAPQRQDDDAGFVRLTKEIRDWTPARGRNTEEPYKVELRNHLESRKYKVHEESGDSDIDLLVQSRYGIEFKKSPDLSGYDRLFGQIARHLQHHPRLIIVIHDATRGDTYNNFATLVDTYFNPVNTVVEIIKK